MGVGMCGDMCDRITWRMKVDPTLLVDTRIVYLVFLYTMRCDRSSFGRLPRQANSSDKL